MSVKKSLWQLSITLSLGVALTIVSGWRATASAQYQSLEDDGFQSNEQDAMFGGGSNGFNPLELIHRANLSNGRSLEEFNSESETNIENSASEFKRLQRERLLQQQSSPSSVEYTPENQ